MLPLSRRSIRAATKSVEWTDNRICRELPRDALQIAHDIKMNIAGKNRKPMLTRLRGDPEIVPRNRPAFREELTAQRSVVRGRGAIDRQRWEFLFDEAKPLLVAPCNAIPGRQSGIPQARLGKAQCVAPLAGDARSPGRRRAMRKARSYPGSLPLPGINRFEFLFDDFFDPSIFLPQLGEGAEMFHPRFFAGRMGMEFFIHRFRHKIAQGASLAGGHGFGLAQ